MYVMAAERLALRMTRRRLVGLGDSSCSGSRECERALDCVTETGSESAIRYPPSWLYLFKTKCPIPRTESTFGLLFYSPMKRDSSFASWGPDDCQCHIWIRIIRQKGFINRYLKKIKSSKVNTLKNGRDNLTVCDQCSFEFKILFMTC